MIGFPSKIAFVATQDGRNVKLLKPIFYHSASGAVYVIPEGAVSDGASSPREIWSFIPPFGEYWLAALLHDSSYQDTLLVVGESGMSKASLTKEQCDLLIKEAMESLGVDAGTVEKVYLGVSLCGWRAFRQDRS